MDFEQRKQKSIKNLESELSRGISDENLKLISIGPSLFERIQTSYSDFLEYSLYNYPEYRKVKDGVTLLTHFGEKFKETVKGRDFIDLGCGHGFGRNLDFLDNFDSNRYIGVDLIKNGISYREIGNEFPVLEVGEEMLSFVSRLDKLDGAVFYFSGIDPIMEFPSQTKDYWHQMLLEIDRLSSPGDSIIIADGTYGLHPEELGFEKIDEMQQDKLYTKK